ncbi:unnamed protein product [Caenorhabditis angaria]|uniref:C3H1-type domain-containing protein n=1 Tax=Caenorhabditis angaria TaxID=860376 RepID=A0A9P1I9Z2_9PELO|nr:unnamed protein product [Caenorhabditis angaria]
MTEELEDGELESDENQEDSNDEIEIDQVIKDAEQERKKMINQQKKKDKTVDRPKSRESYRRKRTHEKKKVISLPPISFFNTPPIPIPDHILPPPPPPPLLPPQPIQIPTTSRVNTDNYASVDMELEDDVNSDIEVIHEKSSRKFELLTSQNENRKRKHLDDEIEEINRELGVMGRKIEKETNLLYRTKRENEKLFHEQERIREKIRKNKLKMSSQKENVFKLYEDKEKLEQRLVSLKREELNNFIDLKSPVYVECDDNNDWKEFEEKINEKKNEKEDVNEDIARIVSQEVSSENVHISEPISIEQKDEDENALREMLLLQTLKKRKRTPPPPPETLQQPLDEINKGRKLLSQLCKYDINGHCKRESCTFLHLSNVQVNERLLLESLFRYIFEYPEEVIGHAVTQTLANKKQTPFYLFIKHLLTNSMTLDEKLRGRFYQFMQGS